MTKRVLTGAAIAAVYVLGVAPAGADIIVGLDPASAFYDAAGATTQNTQSAATRADGMTYNITFTPQTADLSGLVLLMEIGGTSNGTGLYLVDGVPHVIGKMDSTANTSMGNAHDTSYRPTGTGGGTISAAHSGGALTADTEATVGLVYNPSTTTLQLAVNNNLNVDHFILTNLGTRTNWEGDKTLSVKTATNDASGGMKGGGTMAALAGTVSRAVYWNDTGSFHSDLSVVTDIDGDDVNDDVKEGSLTLSLSPSDADGFIAFSSNLNDFVSFNFTIPSGKKINKAWIEIDITDDDNRTLTLYEGAGKAVGAGTTIGATTGAGDNGAPGSWRAISEKTTSTSGINGNQDNRFQLPSSLFANMEDTGALTVDGEWNVTSGGVFGSNRARLIIQTIPEPATLGLLVLGGGVLLARRRRR